MISLPQTLAHRHDPELTDVLNRELPAEKLPLERHVLQGGWPRDARISVRGVSENDHHAVIQLTVEFIEDVPAACPASSRPETRIAYFIARIRKSDASAEIVEDL